MESTVRRLLASFAVALLVAAGLTVTAGGAAQATETTFGTITGTVSFATAPSWDNGDRNFTVALVDYYGNVVPTNLVPISYDYDGGSGFTITYPNSDGDYNNWFRPGSYSYTVAIYPSDEEYPPTYLGGLTVDDTPASEATQLDLSSLPSHVAAGNTRLALGPSISGTLSVPNGFPDGGVQAVAVPEGGPQPIAHWYQVSADVNPDGSYHIPGLRPIPYNVAFVPTGGAAGPGAGIWWNSKPSLTGASVVTLAAGQQKTGINQSLPTGGVITGVLKDSQGRPMQARGGVAIYSASGTSDTRDTLVQQTFLNPDGTYRFWGLPKGTYKLGFNTGIYPPANTALSVRSLDGSAIKQALPTVDLGGFGAANPDGSLGASTYPYTSAWYTASAASFSTAKTVTISSSGQIVGNINGVLPVAAAFSSWQHSERAASVNPTEKPSTCRCADPVDTLSGEFSESKTDLALPGAGLPVQLDRTYASSLAASDGPFGWGSSSSLTAHLEEVPGTDENPYGTVVITQENGSTTTFTALYPRQLYLAPARVNATLVFDWQYNQWVFTRNGTDVFRFTVAGSVVSHQDLHGNVVTFTTDGSGDVTSMTGSGGRSINLFWADGHVTSASDSAGRSVTYGYDSSGELTSFTAADGRITAYGYDGSHQLTTVTAPGGGVTTNAYDDQGRVTQQTDALGRVSTFAYSGDASDSTTTMTDPAGVASTFRYLNGLLVSRTEAAGTTSAITNTFTYDAALDVIKKTDALGKATTMTYDDAGNMLTSTDPLGHTTSYTYDGLHDVTSVTDPLGRVSTATYDSTGSKTSQTSPSGATSSWSFNADGTLATSTDQLGNTASYGYDATGMLVSTTDPLGRTSQTGYDAAGHAISTTDATGAMSSMTVDALGRPLSATDSLGNTTEDEYDDAGNRTSVTAADGTVTTTSFDLDNELVSLTDALGHTTSTTYTALGKVATSTDALGGVTTTTYNLLGRPTQVKDARGLTTTTTYDKDGRVTQVRSPGGNISKTAYDAAGRKISTTDALGHVTTYSYDAADQLISTTDPLGRISTLAYDADGRATVATGPDGHVETTGYDAAGHQITFTDADGNVTTYSYDAAGQVTSRTAPGGLVTGYSYNEVGQVVTLTKPDGSTVDNAYDAARQLLSETPTTGAAISYSYDAMGRRATMTDETGTTTYTYSAVGQPIGITNGAGMTLTYTYDAAGRTTSLGYPGGKNVAYAYDADGRMTSLTDWAHHKISFAWSGDSQLTKQTNPNKVTTSTTYNKNDQVTGISVVNTTSATNLASYQYGYDAGSELTSTTLTDPLHTDAGGDSTTYGYDSRGQLTSVSTGGSFAATPAGLLMQSSEGTTSTYNSALQLAATNNPATVTSSSYTYDGNGARASEATTSSAGTSTTTYTHSWFGALASVATPTASISYTSNGDGLRQSRTDAGGTKQWLWDPTTKIPLLLSDGNDNYLYGPGLTPVAQVGASGAIQYLHADNVGSVRLITDSAGAVAGAADYSPYGASDSTGATSHFGYADSWTDPATSLDYLRAREYDPIVGQFLQVDPALDSTRQAYAYVSNSPLDSADPTGRCSGVECSQPIKAMDSEQDCAGLDPDILPGTHVLGVHLGADGVLRTDADPLQLKAGYDDIDDVAMDILFPGAYHKRYIFVYGGTSYAVWVWKAKYGGYGDGGEIGIYDQASSVPDPGGHWHANPNDPNLPKMTESLSVNGLDVASFAPSKAQSWVGSWRPGLNDMNMEDLKVTDTVTFTSAAMYGAFMNSPDVKHSGWASDPTTSNTAVISY